MKHAVISGDIVSSEKILAKKDFYKHFKASLKEISEVLNPQFEFEFFRGDSFQTIVNEPSDSLLIAILIRASLRMITIETDGPSYNPDARISIGIGTIDYKTDKVIESDGEAFRLSGRGLEQMTEKGERLGIFTPNEKLNDELNVASQLTDVLISNWTPASSEAVYYTTLHKMSQMELAQYLKISQPAIHKRLNISHFDKISLFLERFQKVIADNF